MYGLLAKQTADLCRRRKWAIGRNLKILGRLSIKYADLALLFGGYGDYDRTIVYVDAEWAKCLSTRNLQVEAWSL